MPRPGAPPTRHRAAGTTVKSCGTQSPGAPSSTSTRRPRAPCARRRRQCVGQRRTGESRRLLRGAGRRQAGLDAPGGGCLGDDEQGGAHTAHAVAPTWRIIRAPPPCRGPRAASRARCRSPSSGRGAGRCRTGTSRISQPGRRGADHHLERPAEAPVAEPEREQRLAAGGAHRPQIGQAHAAAPPQLERERAVRQPPWSEPPRAHRALGVAGRDRRRRARDRPRRPRPGRRPWGGRAGRRRRRSP